MTENRLRSVVTLPIALVGMIAMLFPMLLFKIAVTIDNDGETVKGCIDGVMDGMGLTEE